MRALILVMMCLFAAPAQAITVDIPGASQNMSGIYVVSAWDCISGVYTVQFDGGSTVQLSYGSERLDTPCTSPNNGIVSIFNYNVLRAGAHVAEFFRDGVPIAVVNFQVVLVNGEVLTNVSGTGVMTLSNGQQLSLEWRQGQQGPAITAATAENTSVLRLNSLIGEWEFNSQPFGTDFQDLLTFTRLTLTGGVPQLLVLDRFAVWTTLNRVIDIVLPETDPAFSAFEFFISFDLPDQCFRYGFDTIDATSVQGLVEVREAIEGVCDQFPALTLFTGTRTDPPLQ